ncbi:MAG: 4-oxalocrotonate tautomerase family protein [Acidobacteria bacterium]|nr:4-oxalocrotonate tautomerase family protein [Acidobacteriota bacterium]
MPLVEITLVEGRSREQLRRLIDAITAAVETSISAPRESIRVILREVPASHYAAGGETIEERRSKGKRS